VEEQIAELTAQVAALQASAGVTNTMFAETYYYLTIPLMIIIHAGFLAYEMGASRMRNVLSSGVKNILAFAFMIPTFYFFGWWVYWAFPTGITLSAGAAGISGAEYASAIAFGWGESAQYMGPNIADQASGVFFGAFALFACTTASIMSGAVIERIQTVGFTILAIVLGSFAWVVAAAWGWHAEAGHHVRPSRFRRCRTCPRGCRLLCSWRVGQSWTTDRQIQRRWHGQSSGRTQYAFDRDRFDADYRRFLGLLDGLCDCSWRRLSWFGDKASTIYGTPITLSALAFNILMGIAGGIIGAWIYTKDPFWMMSGALAGIISVASGLDIYFPGLAFIIAFGAGVILQPCAVWLEKRGIDDAVGAVTVHGTIGLYGLIALGVFASGYPALQGEGVATVSLVGQIVGAIVFFLLGFVPGYVVSLILNGLGMLRTPEAAEKAGLDPTKVPAQAYPEGISASPAASS